MILTCDMDTVLNDLSVGPFLIFTLGGGYEGAVSPPRGGESNRGLDHLSFIVLLQSAARNSAPFSSTAEHTARI